MSYSKAWFPPWLTPADQLCCYGHCPLLLWKTNLHFRRVEPLPGSCHRLWVKGSTAKQIYLSVVGLISTELLWFS